MTQAVFLPPSYSGFILRAAEMCGIYRQFTDCVHASSRDGRRKQGKSRKGNIEWELAGEVSRDCSGCCCAGMTARDTADREGDGENNGEKVNEYSNTD